MRLSMREQKVLVELARGCDLLDIARQLGLTSVVVASYINMMYRKTGTKNNVQLLRWALREARRVVALERLKGEWV